MTWTIRWTNAVGNSTGSQVGFELLARIFSTPITPKGSDLSPGLFFSTNLIALECGQGFALRLEQCNCYSTASLINEGNKISLSSNCANLHRPTNIGMNDFQ